MGWEVGWVCGVCLPLRLVGLVFLFLYREHGQVDCMVHFIGRVRGCPGTEIGDGLDLG